eukprot:Em0001g1183a
MSLRTALKETELYHLLRWHNEDAVSVVANSAVTMLSEGGVGCSIKWGKKLYYGDVVASGRILDYGRGADDEVSPDAETPSQPTSQPVPATTSEPVPATTFQPVPATTSLHMLAQSHQSEPPRALCSPLRTSPSPRWSLSPPPLPSPYRPPLPVYPSDTNVVKAVQKMDASIVDAIRDLKEALLGKLDEIALSGKPSWPASDIEKTNLRPPEFTVQCHRNLTTESKIHTLALKLATESFWT